MVGSPLTPASARRPYMFYQREGRTHQRGARAVELLDRARGVTPEEAMAIALDDRSFQYERWTSALRDADARFGASHKGNGDYQSALGEIAAWDGRSSRDSRGALKFYYWRQAARAALGAGYPQAAGKLDDTMAALGKSKGSSEPLSEAEQKGLVDGLVSSVRTMRRNHGRIDLVYGDVFRVGRDDRSWPVGGGSLGEEGMATLRALGFGAPRADHTRWGVSGQTSTEVVVLTRPIRSWTQPPIGLSDRPESPFYRDQAEKLFGPGRMKPTWYQKDDLLKHVSSRQELPVGPMEPR
jgi:acyl-homoserine lactone acylase PvdQ